MLNKIAFLGLGAMGSRMSANLIQSGHELHVWNRTQTRCCSLVETGATLHATPRDTAQEADLTITMVRDDQTSKAVWLDEDAGALSRMEPDAIAIECSTLSLDWCTQLTNHMTSRQIQFLDAPVVGSRQQVEVHQLIHLVGGNADIRDLSHQVTGRRHDNEAGGQCLVRHTGCRAGRTVWFPDPARH